MNKQKKTYFQSIAMHFGIFVVATISIFLIMTIALDILEDKSMAHYLENTYNTVPTEFLEEAYSSLSSTKLGHGGFFEIYDSELVQIYPIEGFAKYSVEELDLIPNEKNRPIITIEYYEEFGSIEYQEITFEYYTDLRKTRLDILVLDDNLNVSFTTLDGIEGTLAQREVDLLCGNDDDSYELSKMTYKNDAGEQRIAVFYRKYSSLNRITNSFEGRKGYLAVSFILIFLISAIVFLVYLNRKVKMPLALLTEAIQKSSHENNAKTIAYKGPYEFEEVCKSFNEMQIKLDLANKKREEAEEAKVRILADISHDLKTPITVILGFAEALLDEKICDEHKKRYYERIRSKSELLAKMIDAFSEYNRLERKDVVLKLEMVDISSFARAYFIDRYDEIVLYGFNLEVNIEDHISCGMDTFLMTRVFDNILSNAMKYTARGTTIHFAMEQSGEHVKIIFGDDGCGLDSSIANTIFEPFTVGETARTASNGTGLGMAIVKRIIELHNGSILLCNASSPNTGTVYSITLLVSTIR